MLCRLGGEIAKQTPTGLLLASNDAVSLYIHLIDVPLLLTMKKQLAVRQKDKL